MPPKAEVKVSPTVPVLFKPFETLRAPEMKLRLPHSLPSWSVVFCFVFASYFLVTSGIIYDLIVKPPAIGSEQDPVTGSVKPVAFVKYRVNGQFIIEVCCTSTNSLT